MTGEVDESAVAMIGGIVVATLLTLLFLQALYVAWYRLKQPTSQANA
jgi:multidrug efflux pump subunit AcrB